MTADSSSPADATSRVALLAAAMIAWVLAPCIAAAAIPVPPGPASPTARRDPPRRAPQRQQARPASPPARASISGSWLLTMVVNASTYRGMLDITDEDGDANTLIVNTPDGDRVQQTCRVDRLTSLSVQIACRDARYVVGSGSYSPDSFKVEIRGSRVMSGVTVDSASAFGTAEFVRP